jgi:hypothetical protein
LVSSSLFILLLLGQCSLVLIAAAKKGCLWQIEEWYYCGGQPGG